MQCPSCQNPLSEQSVAGLAVFACVGSCCGLWFPRRAVRRLSALPRAAGRALLALPRAEGVRLFRDPEHPCPRCQTTLLYRHGFIPRLETEIDQCAKCGGFWVDPGALARLNDPDLPEEKRQALARDYFEELFEKRVRGMNLVNHDTLEAAREIIRIFQFITPEAYGPSHFEL